MSDQADQVSDQADRVASLSLVMAGIVFGHLLNGDDVDIVNGNAMISYGPNTHNIDGAAIDLRAATWKDLQLARLNGRPVEDQTLDILIVKATLFAAVSNESAGGSL